ncbi:tyrosine recombinase XerC [Nonomuraea sp. NPDC050783]|uniref:site-specific integrase n=1 Tax=Nonomuraea sp. NPDC050783 TaxID=3154634 RepID=UPI0034657A6F
MALAFGCGLTSGEVAAVQTGHLRRDVFDAIRYITDNAAKWAAGPGPESPTGSVMSSAAPSGCVQAAVLTRRRRHRLPGGGDTKTKESRPTLAMPRRCADALKFHHERQDVAKEAAGDRWQDNDLVFASKVGTELDAHDVRRSFRGVLRKAGLDPKDRTPRGMRHSFVSLLSDSGMPIEAISRLAGHRNTTVTETVYRKQLRPLLLEGAEAMDRIFLDG